jgi:N-acetylneuraminate synthase
METKVIAEIGINHNGDINIAKQLISLASIAGCQYVKVQKRNPDVCVPEHQKSKPKSTPWGDMTYLEYKHKIEFSKEQMIELYNYAESLGTNFFASVWDTDSVDVMKDITDIGKIPSALITDLELCKYARDNFKTLIISTGMSTEQEIIDCVKCCNPDVIMHSNSTYPCPTNELNLRYIEHLGKKYPDKEIGYSGHEYSLPTTYAAVVLGATWVERHITLSRKMWGSDQKSSIEPAGLFHMMSSIKAIEGSIQHPSGERILFEGELSKRKSLRGV